MIDRDDIQSAIVLGVQEELRSLGIKSYACLDLSDRYVRLMCGCDIVVTQYAFYIVGDCRNVPMALRLTTVMHMFELVDPRAIEFVCDWAKKHEHSGGDNVVDHTQGY